MNGWGTDAFESVRGAAVDVKRPRAVGAQPAAVAGGVAARIVMVISVVPRGEDLVDILDWDSRGRHDEGEHGDKVGELHFGLLSRKRVALVDCCFVELLRTP
jgi:hypothetical protein